MTIVPETVAPAPLNMRFQPGKRPEEESLPAVFSKAPLLPKQLPPLTHQDTLPDLLAKEKLAEQKILHNKESKILSKQLSKKVRSVLSVEKVLLIDLESAMA